MEQKKPLILVVDDIMENIKIVGDNLRNAGYLVAIADNGQDALNAVENLKPDLILLDIQMPEMDGYEVCRRVKSVEATAGIPVIFLTAKSGIDEIVKGFDVGGVDYITKPFNSRELLARVKTHLELKFYREKVEEMSLFDEITKVPNKRYFNKYYETEWRRAARENTDMSIIFIDIDYFKNYNDTYGHLEGDRCLASIASSIKKCAERAGDFMARFGGEEFIYILPNTAREGAMFVAEDMRKSVMELKIEHRGSSVYPYVTISIGVVSFMPHIEKDMDNVLIQADTALYTAKNNGRNRVEFYKKETMS